MGEVCLARRVQHAIAAATFLAAVGDIGRFASSKRVVAYLGLDPMGPPVRRDTRPLGLNLKTRVGVGELDAGRGDLVGRPPARAVRSRRGHSKAIVATARKLAVLFWCMLTREQDYAHQQPSLTARKLRLLEVRAGAPTLKGKQTGVFATHQRMRQAEKQLAAQAQASYERAVRDWKATSPKKKDVGASVTAECA